MNRYSPFSRKGAADKSSRTSSVYSEQSEKQSRHQDRSNGTGRRAALNGFIPSYMSHHASKSVEQLGTFANVPTTQSSNGQQVTRKPIPSPARTPPQLDADLEPAGVPPGILFVFTAGAIHSSTLSNLEILLDQQKFSNIVLAARKTQEVAVKQLKMDVYSLIGRMSQEIGVSVHTREEWNQSEMEGIVKEETKPNAGIQGVLCCPEFDEGETSGGDIVGLSEDQLDRSWRQSVSFLHASIRATVANLLERCKPLDLPTKGLALCAPQGPCFLVAGSSAQTPASQITKAACDTLILQVEGSTKAKGLTVGFAEAMLIPKAPSPKTAVVEPKLRPQSFATSPQASGFTPSESPTKLWNMWALQNDIGAVDD